MQIYVITCARVAFADPHVCCDACSAQLTVASGVQLEMITKKIQQAILNSRLPLQKVSDQTGNEACRQEKHRCVLSGARFSGSCFSIRNKTMRVDPGVPLARCRGTALAQHAGDLECSVILPQHRGVACEAISHSPPNLL